MKKGSGFISNLSFFEKNFYQKEILEKIYIISLFE